MKTRMCLILLGVMGIGAVSGCGRSAEKPQPEPTFANEPTPSGQPAESRTVRIRNPETGRIETRQIPAVMTDDADKPQQRYTTQRRRNPETGKIETVRVPVPEKSQSADEPNRQVRRRAAATPAKPAEPSEQKYDLSWPVDCSVLTAYAPVRSLIYDQLRLDMLDNPNGDGELKPAVDYMSAVLKARSAVGVVFEVTLLADSPDTCTATVATSSQTQLEEFLKTHAQFLKEQINQTLSQPSDKTPQALYPKTMVVDQPIDAASEKIRAWGQKQGFRGSASGSDQYYKHLSYSSGSNIEFGFSMRLIDTNKTKLDISISNYHGKDEFPMILKSLEEMLSTLQEEKSDAG